MITFIKFGKFVDIKDYIKRGANRPYYTSSATEPSDVKCRSRAQQSGKPLET